MATPTPEGVMENKEWQEFVESLVDAKRQLAHAWGLLDGIDGAAPGWSTPCSPRWRASTLSTRPNRRTRSITMSPRRPRSRSSGLSTERCPGSRSVPSSTQTVRRSQVSHSGAPRRCRRRTGTVHAVPVGRARRASTRGSVGGHVGVDCAQGAVHTRLLRFQRRERGAHRRDLSAYGVERVDVLFRAGATSASTSNVAVRAIAGLLVVGRCPAQPFTVRPHARKGTYQWAVVG